METPHCVLAGLACLACVLSTTFLCIWKYGPAGDKWTIIGEEPTTLTRYLSNILRLSHSSLRRKSSPFRLSHRNIYIISTLVHLIFAIVRRTFNNCLHYTTRWSTFMGGKNYTAACKVLPHTCHLVHCHWWLWSPQPADILLVNTSHWSFQRNTITLILRCCFYPLGLRAWDDVFHTPA